MDFADVPASNKDESIRAWAVEKALENLYAGAPGSTIINISKMIEDYVKTGSTEGVITDAVDEGYREGRFQVKEVVEEWSSLNLDELFISKGWMSDPADPNQT